MTGCAAFGKPFKYSFALLTSFDRILFIPYLKTGIKPHK